jgi:hypothetical protein
MAVPPVLALKAVDSSRQAVAKSLTGDIYVKRWSTVRKRPKHKGGPQVIDHELHVNPVSVGLGLVALGGAAAVAAAALWLGQRKVTYGADDKNPAIMWRIVKQYGAQTQTVTVVDQPAWDETVQVPMWTPTGFKWVTTVIHHPAITHEETVVTRPERVVVTTLRGVPVRTYQGSDTTADAILSEREKSLGWAYAESTVLGEGKDTLGSYLKMKYKFVNPTKKRLGTTEREGFLA